MAFDFNNCKLVGPENDRFGAAGLMIPPKVVDCPAREMLALADKWNWPKRSLVSRTIRQAAPIRMWLWGCLKVSFCHSIKS